MEEGKKLKKSLEELEISIDEQIKKLLKKKSEIKKKKEDKKYNQLFKDIKTLNDETLNKIIEIINESKNRS